MSMIAGSFTFKNSKPTLTDKFVIAREWRYAHLACGMKPSWKELKRVFDLYSRGDRHYHMLTHIADCLRWMRKMFPDDRHPVVIMAIIYHDSIYDVRSKVNEELSAEEFAFYATGVFPDCFVARGRELIGGTKGHQRTDDRFMQIVLDCDLHVLSAEWTRYLAYARGVWREYSVFGKEGYRQGRRNFLETANMEFSSPEMQDRNGLARSNMAMELRYLDTEPDYLLV